MGQPLLLIDGDLLLYKAMAALEKEIQWSPDVWSLWCDTSAAKANIRAGVEKLAQQVPHAKITVCLSDSGDNFRKHIDPTYKGQRKATRKPAGFLAVKEWMAEEFSAVTKPALEADDILGILATKPNNEAIIWSLDKDLRQIPSQHLVDGEIVQVSSTEADLYFMTQVLTGDPVDNYPGCPGTGPKKAEKLLEPVWHDRNDAPFIDLAWPIIVETYEKAGLTEADAIKQARLARILRWHDWDQSKQEVKLWEPPLNRNITNTTA